jgi:hypothetical protein
VCNSLVKVILLKEVVKGTKRLHWPGFNNIREQVQGILSTFRSLGENESCHGQKINQIHTVICKGNLYWLGQNNTLHNYKCTCL